MAARALLPLDSQPGYKLSERVGVVEDLVAKIEDGVPPNEIGKWPNAEPATFADILNAAWAFKLKKIAGGGWGGADDFEALFRLTLKAVETAHVHSLYAPRLKAALK